MPSKQVHLNASMVATSQTMLWNFHSHFTQSDTNVKLLQKQSWMQSVAIWPLKQWFIHLNAKYNLGSMSLKPMRTNICIGQKRLWRSTIFSIAGLHGGVSGHTQSHPQQEGMPSTWVQEGTATMNTASSCTRRQLSVHPPLHLWPLSRMEEKCMECSKNNACSAGRNTAAVTGKTTALVSGVELSLAQEKVKSNF